MFDYIIVMVDQAKIMVTLYCNVEFQFYISSQIKFSTKKLQWNGFAAMGTVVLPL